MDGDELQRWASILRWLGLSITALGVFITFGSHYIADRLLILQRTEKAQAQTQLRETKARTAELEKRLAPRRLSQEQRERFIQYLSSAPKGPIAVAHSGLAPETVDFANQVRALVQQAGFTISLFENPFGYTIKAPEPWFVAIVIGPGVQPPYAKPLLLAFKHIGIEAIPVDGSKIAAEGQLKVYVGAK